MYLLVISGGRHPYEESTPVLERFLTAAGHHVTVTEDASVLSDSQDMGGYDALVFNTRRENVPDFGDWTLSRDQQDGLKEYIGSGKAFICLHISGVAPDTWPEYHEIIGGGWVSGTSYHPPYSEMKVNVSDYRHEAVAGVSDFLTEDELYMGLRIIDGNDVFLTGHAKDGTYPWGSNRTPKHMPGGTFPLGWTRTYGRGKVFVLLLGHDGRSFETLEFQKMVLNGVEWATSGLLDSSSAQC